MTPKPFDLLELPAISKSPQKKSSRFGRRGDSGFHRTAMIAMTFIFNVLSTGKPNVVVLDIVTQAGTYVKELVHGEFGRTEPSIASFIGIEIDIVALDVMAIELDFPKSLQR